jgi:phospholipase C
VVCGDLTSTFRPYLGEKIDLPVFLSRNDFIEEVHKAKFKKEPSGYRALTEDEIKQINARPASSPLMPRQEKGTRRSCSLPYQLYADGGLTADKNNFQLTFAASKEMFGAKAAGSPFNVYASKLKTDNSNSFVSPTNRSYAVAPGDELTDSWKLEQFEDSRYHLSVYGPNGFFREFTGDATDPLINIRCDYAKAKKKKTSTGLEFKFKNQGSTPIEVQLVDLSYGRPAQKQRIEANSEKTFNIDLNSSHGWYDYTLNVIGGSMFGRRFSGRVETGEMGFTDPAIG